MKKTAVHCGDGREGVLFVIYLFLFIVSFAIAVGSASARSGGLGGDAQAGARATEYGHVQSTSVDESRRR